MVLSYRCHLMAWKWSASGERSDGFGQPLRILTQPAESPASVPREFPRGRDFQWYCALSYSLSHRDMRGDDHRTNFRTLGGEYRPWSPIIDHTRSKRWLACSPTGGGSTLDARCDLSGRDDEPRYHQSRRRPITLRGPSCATSRCGFPRY